MSIISFWSGSEKETSQTVSIAAFATYLGVVHNYKILLMDATFNDDTMSRCFGNVHNQNNAVKALNAGKLDIATGAEGLVSAVASNKSTPEIITNFTKPILKGHLDFLPGLKTKERKEFDKSLSLYKDLLQAANKYYDYILVDLEKTLEKENTKILLETSQIIVYTFTQNLRQVEEYIKTVTENRDLLTKDKIIPLLANADINSKYNSKNVARFIKDKNLCSISYNPAFKERACEAGLVNFFVNRALQNEIDKAAMSKFLLSNTSKRVEDYFFIKDFEDMDKKIEQRLEELKYKV